VFSTLKVTDFIFIPHKGVKLPADVIGGAVKVMRIATGEEEEDAVDDGKDPVAKA